ncbi:MAG TPA: MBL fold metallo-hydrolase [Thermomicrobiales bacterium]|nr:MBL fold metallo-hydrolase [Thermomicrobiales bacterium]
MADFRWYGHNGFRIRTKAGTVITDPPEKSTGYALTSRPSADIVTISNDNTEHKNLKSIKDEYALIDGPGEYEIHDIFVYGVRSYHDDQKGAEFGYNTIFVFEVEGMRVAHLGDLGHPLTPDLTDALDNIDVLLVPAGGGTGIITPEQAAKLIETIEPNVVIPMQFRTSRGDTGAAPIEELASHLGIDLPEPVEKISLRSTDFDDTMSFMVMSPAT